MVVQVYLMTLIGPVRTMKKTSVCWGSPKKWTFLYTAIVRFCNLARHLNHADIFKNF